MKKDDIEASKDIQNVNENYYYAIKAGDIEALIEIEKTVSDVKKLFMARFFHSSFTQPLTAIQAAAYYGHTLIIAHLISLGAEFGVEAMVGAIKRGQIETMVYLNQGVPEKQRIAFNIRFNINLIHNRYEDITFMHIAALYNQTHVMMFLNKDQRVLNVERLPYNVETARGTTPMDMAASRGHIDAMLFLNKNCHVAHNQTIRQDYVLNLNPPQNRSEAVRTHQESHSYPYLEILRKLEEQGKIIKELFQFQQEILQGITGHTELRRPSSLTENIQEDSSSSSETNSNNKRPVPRDKAKLTSSLPENNKRQKTASITAVTVEALNSQGFLGQERNRALDQEVVYAGDRPHPLGGQSLDNLARMAKIKTEYPDEESEVDSSMNHGG